MAGASKTFRSKLVYAYAVSGKKDQALEIFNDVRTRSSDGFSNASEIALIYIGLGDINQAMIWLEKSYNERFNPSLLMRPCFDSLRSDPRFQGLLRRIGFSTSS